MHPKCLKWLHDILEACELIEDAARGRSLADYERDRLLRSAVERNVEIIGEALNRIHNRCRHRGAYPRSSRDHQFSERPDPRLRFLSVKN